MSKQITQTYAVLDEIEHVRKRTGMYAGSTELQTSNEWVYDPADKKMVKRTVAYIPALVKIFSEILDNAIDESRRAPDKLDTIRVEFDQDGTISVQDNGRGIPVQVHPQTGRYVAETVFSNLRAGSNFNDDEDQQLIGTNGVGSTLTNILSTSFKIESCDGKNLFRQEFRDGMRTRGEPKITADTKNRTKITFCPDYAFFKLEGLSSDHALKMAKKVVDAAACNPHVKFYVNGDRIQVHDFGDYIALYSDEYVYDDNTDWKVGISHSDGFEAVSFVNSVETYQGGTHIWYVMDQITDRLREYLKKKYKVEVKPADVRNHMRVYISANVNRPKFSSQTKENMISQPSTYKTSWAVPDKFINKLIKSPIIQSVLDWAEAKNKAEELAELRKNSKNLAKASAKRIEKFTDAVEKKDRHLCECYFTEGDCLSEDTVVYALTDAGQKHIKIKDLMVGDMVLTHNNRFREVSATTVKVKEGVKIKYDEGEITVSQDHRLMVFDRELQRFGYLTAGELDPLRHELVQNNIVRRNTVADEIIRIEHTDTGVSLTTEADVDWEITNDHKIMVFTKDTLAFEVKSGNSLKIGDSIAMIPSAKYRINSGRNHEVPNTTSEHSSITNS